MASSRFRIPALSEQHVLDNVQLHLLAPAAASRSSLTTPDTSSARTGLPQPRQPHVKLLAIFIQKEDQKSSLYWLGDFFSGLKDMLDDT